MSKLEITVFSLLLILVLVAGFVFVGMVDIMGQQFLSVGLDLNKSVLADAYITVSK